MSYELRFTKQAQKDAKKLKNTPLSKKAKELLEILKQEPFQTQPPFEALVADLKGAYSRRISVQHRMVYQVIEREEIVKVIRMWSHYG